MCSWLPNSAHDRDNTDLTYPNLDPECRRRIRIVRSILRQAAVERYPSSQETAGLFHAATESWDEWSDIDLFPCVPSALTSSRSLRCSSDSDLPSFPAGRLPEWRD